MPNPVGAVMRRLDSTWRVTMPEHLAEAYPNSFVLTPGFDNSIRAYRTEQYEELDQVLKGLDTNDPDQAEYVSFFRSLAAEVTLDSSARFRFTDAHMSWLGVGLDKRDVVVFDAGNYVEFWEVGRWNEFLKQRASSIKDLARSIFGKRRETPEQEQGNGAGTSAGNGERDPELP